VERYITGVHGDTHDRQLRLDSGISCLIGMNASYVFAFGPLSETSKIIRFLASKRCLRHVQIGKTKTFVGASVGALKIISNLANLRLADYFATATLK
jgi:hypothetical protein